MQHKAVILIGFMPNPRIYKRIELEKQICDLHLICWDRGKAMLLPPENDGYTAHVINIAAGGDPLKRLIPYRRFAYRALSLLNSIQPSIIHVQGLDMLKIAVAYKKRSKRKVSIIYEVADLHRLLVDKQTGIVRKVAQKYLCHEDRRLEKYYDLLIITSQKYYEVYFGGFVAENKVLFMPNVPDLSAFKTYKHKKEQLPFTVGYIGAVRYKKQMMNLLTAATECGCNLLIAGYEDEPVVIQPLCQTNPNIEWVGRFDFNARAAELYGRCDVMYSVYDADMNNVRVAIPNKLYEAVFCEMPLIVARDTYLASIVEEWGVGVAVDHNSTDELIKVIRHIQENKECLREFASNCRLHKDYIDADQYNAALKAQIIGSLNR